MVTTGSYPLWTSILQLLELMGCSPAAVFGLHKRKIRPCSSRVASGDEHTLTEESFPWTNAQHCTGLGCSLSLIHGLSSCRLEMICHGNHRKQQKVCPSIYCWRNGRFGISQMQMKAAQDTIAHPGSCTTRSGNTKLADGIGGFSVNSTDQ